MATRAPSHADQERAIFEAFLTAYPSFAAQVTEFRQPDVEFPDVVVKLIGGAEVDFELGEWLDGHQMAEARQYERLESGMLDSIGPQAPNTSPHFRAVMLTPREDAPAFAVADAEGFRAELSALVGETDRRWPSERSWHSPQGRMCRDRTVRKLVPRSRRLIVVAEQAAQAVAVTNSDATDRPRSRCNQIVAEALVIPLLMVVRRKLFEHVQ
jgi:hypothetical protein